MKINVRNARRLDQEIATVVDALTTELTPVITISAFAQVTPEFFKEATEKMLEQATDVGTLSGFRFTLRHAISQANQAEVNVLTGQLAAKEKGLEIIGKLLKKEEPDPYARRGRGKITPYVAIEKLDARDINQRLAALAEATKQGQSSGQLEVSLLTTEIATNLKQSIGRIKRDINKLKDQIAASNLTTKVEIEISEEIQKLLARYGLTVE